MVTDYASVTTDSKHNSTSSDCCTLLNLNCCSLLNKLCELQTYLDTLTPSVDILLITEHWFSKDYMDFLQIDGYDLGSFYGRDSSGHGGAALLFKTNSDTRRLTEIEDLAAESVCEIAAAKADNWSFYVISLYRPPSGDFASFIEILHDALDLLYDKQNVILAGDFNVHFDDITDVHTSELLNTMLSYGFNCLFTDPTRHNRCLDNIFVNFNADLCTCKTLSNDFSDHAGQLLCIPSKREDAVRHRFGRFLTPNKILLINELLWSTDWSLVSNGQLSLDDSWSKFLQMFVSCIDRVAPLKKKQLKNSKTRSLGPWFTQELKTIREGLSIMNHSLRVFRSNELLSCRNALRTFYRKSLVQTRRMAYENMIASVNDNGKLLWKLINSKRGMKRHQAPAIHPEVFNDFFIDAPKRLAANITKSPRDPLAFDIPMMPGNFSFLTVTTTDVASVVVNLPRSNTLDCFGLTSDLLTNCLSPVSETLTYLINLSIEHGCFPNCLKSAIIHPIHKKGSLEEVSNYRPIAILPVLSKVLERILKHQIVSFLENNRLICPNQFGFRRGLSTQDAILSLVQKVSDAFEHKGYCSITLFDLSRAFDCVDHHLLLKKMEKYGINGCALNLLRSYLDNRSQHVALGDATSNIRTISMGVPQGSVLGPLLFILYINDLSQIDPILDFHLYADDTTVSYSSSDLSTALEMESHARSIITDWFAANHLTANRDKSRNIMMSLCDLKNHRNLDSVKLLGVILDPGLNFKEHVLSLTKKINRDIFLLRRLSKMITSTYLLKVYYGLIHSRISYSILAWGHAPLARNLVFRLQRKAIRIVFGLHYRSDCKAYFSSNRILTFPSIYILRSILMAHRTLNDLCTGSSYHQHYTRGRDMLRPEFCRINRTRNSSSYWSPVFLNCLPILVRQWSGMRLKKRLSDYLREKAFYSFQEFLENNFDYFN